MLLPDRRTDAARQPIIRAGSENLFLTLIYSRVMSKKTTRTHTNVIEFNCAHDTVNTQNV